jgi:secondary thiamine-phosphate synthase enzyme
MESFTVKTKGFGDIIDITNQVEELVRQHGLKEGLVCVSLASATTGVTTIEYETGALQDLKDALERLVPMGIDYAHDKKWGDGNGFAHIRSALVKNSLVLPVSQGRVIRGTWQQIVLIDFDNRPRTREVLVQTVASKVNS